MFSATRSWTPRPTNKRKNRSLRNSHFLREKNGKAVRSGIRTHAYKSRLRPERSALDRSATLTTLMPIINYLQQQTGQFTVWTNDKQNSGLINFIPESRLQFVQIQTIYRKYLYCKKGCFEEIEWNTNFRLENSAVQKNLTIFSNAPFLPGIFRWNDTKTSRVSFTFQHDFPERFCKL